MKISDHYNLLSKKSNLSSYGTTLDFEKGANFSNTFKRGKL